MHATQKSQKTSSFCTSTAPIPQRVARGPQKSQKNLEFFTNPQNRGHTAEIAKKTSSRPRRSPQRVALLQRFRPTATTLLLLSKRGHARGHMQGRICRRRYAGEDMQELFPAYPLLHVLSSPTYLLLHVLHLPHIIVCAYIPSFILSYTLPPV